MAKVEKKVDWETLEEIIHQGKCILCIGPELFVSPKGVSLDNQLFEYITKGDKKDKNVVAYQDGLLFLKDSAQRDQIVSRIKRFYQQSFPEAEHIISLLVEIPFNIIVFLTPDNKYEQIAKGAGLEAERDFYWKNRAPRITRTPAKSAPIVYHLFGCINEEESLVLTHDDLYDFFESIFIGESMSKEMKKTIENARHFICLGLPFEKWYMQILMRVLNLRNEKMTKYATILSSRETQTLFEDQFKITFVPYKIKDFVQELHRRFPPEKRRKPLDKKHALRDEIETLLYDNQIIEALDRLNEHIKNARLGNEITNNLITLRSRFIHANQERRNGALKLEDFTPERAQVVAGILELTATIEKL